jgi:hypothetical protein
MKTDKNKTYSEKLKDPRWQKRRLEIMQKADFSCEECGDNESSLQIHHRIYRKGKQPWEYDNEELVCLCEECHMGAENDRETVSEAMAISCMRPLLVSVSAEMLNAGPLDDVLHNLKRLMMEGQHSYVAKGPVLPERKNAGLRICASHQRLVEEISDGLAAFVADIKTQWEALEEIKE